MKKTFSVIILFLLIISSFSFGAFAFNETLIDDAADLFTEEQEAEISEALLAFTSETAFSSAVITADYADGKTSQEYADDYYDNLVVTHGWSQNGILFLIDMDNREVCISTMGECIEIFDYHIDYIIDTGYDALTNGEYSDCILLMIESVHGISRDSSVNSDDYADDGYYSEDISYFYNDYNYNDYNGDDFANQSSHIGLREILGCIAVSLVIAGISVLAVKSSYKNTGKGDEFDADDVILNLTGSNDTVISRNVITTKIPRNNNHRHGGGSSHGGGGSHRSSGGFSHGGGSRKF